MKSKKALQLSALAPDWLLRKLIPCKTAVSLASRTLDGKLSITERLQLRLHLLVCTLCVRYLGQIRLIRKTLNEMGTTPGQKNALTELSDEARERMKKTLR